VREASGITLAIDGINLTASIVTLAANKQYAPRLVAAVRRWRLHQDKDSITLTVKGGGIDMTIDLPPNISTQRLLEQLTPLLEKDYLVPKSSNPAAGLRTYLHEPDASSGWMGGERRCSGSAEGPAREVACAGLSPTGVLSSN